MRPHRYTWSNTITLTSTLAGLALLAGCSSSAPSPPAATATASPSAPAAVVPASASARLGAAQDALRAAGMVHIDITSSVSGVSGVSGSSSASVQFSDDSGANGGRQLITVNKTGHATILFIDGTGYIKADTPSLAGFMECDQAQAEAAANRWIYLRPGDKFCGTDYDAVTDGITLSSVAGELAMKDGTATTTAPATVAGQRVVGVQGQPSGGQVPASAKEVLYLTDDARLRPVLSEQTAAGVKSDMSFRNWGERLTLIAPKGAVPASSIPPASTIT